MESAYWFFLSMFLLFGFIAFAATCYIERNDGDPWF